MSPGENRTPERLLMIGCTAFAGIDCVAWEEGVVPNIPDYDLIVVSVPHITKDFLAGAPGKFFENIRKALVRFLHSKGKMVVLVSPSMAVKRPSEYPQWLSNLSWCPIEYGTTEESGRSIVWKRERYPSYLKKMTEWSFWFGIPNKCLTDELISLYGSPSNTLYRLPLEPYLENRYGRPLAGQLCVEVRRARSRSDGWGHTSAEYPESPDVTTGQIVLLPLLDKVSPEEALADILKDEIGYTAMSPEPDWTRDIEMPFVSDLKQRISEAESAIAGEQQKISENTAQINDICSYRRLLYGTGPELENIVKKSFEYLGATVSPAKYAQEEYILQVGGEEFLVEVKGVAKSISLTHLRQLSDYLLKYQEDTGKECKGILFGNAWRNHPPDQRGTEDTPEFPDNVVKRAEQLHISLVSSKDFFRVFVQALQDKALALHILRTVTTSEGIAQF